MPSHYGDPVESFGNGESYMVAAKHDEGVRISVGKKGCKQEEIMTIDLESGDVQRLGAALMNMAKILFAEQTMRFIEISNEG